MRIKLQDSKNPVATSGAYTLMEILVAAAVVAVMFVTLYAGVSAGFGIIQVARENLRATQIMQEKMETIRLYTWDQINTTNFIPATFTEKFYANANGATNDDKASLTYSGKVTIGPSGLTETYSNDLKKVSVQISWTSGKKLRTHDMSTLVTKNGLQNYIY